MKLFKNNDSEQIKRIRKQASSRKKRAICRTSAGCWSSLYITIIREHLPCAILCRAAAPRFTPSYNTPSLSLSRRSVERASETARVGASAICFGGFCKHGVWRAAAVTWGEACASPRPRCPRRSHQRPSRVRGCRLLPTGELRRFDGRSAPGTPLTPRPFRTYPHPNPRLWPKLQLFIISNSSAELVLELHNPEKRRVSNSLGSDGYRSSICLPIASQVILRTFYRINCTELYNVMQICIL